MTAFGAKFCTPANEVAVCGGAGLCLPGGICKNSVAGTVGGKASWVNFTGTSYDGALNGTGSGYTAANNLCGAGNHVCTAEDVLSLYAQGIAPITGAGWINAGPPGYTARGNDCGGWTSNDGSYLGRYWNFAALATDGKQGWMRPCNVTGILKLPFACCK